MFVYVCVCVSSCGQAIIVDEAAQAVELTCLIPLRLHCPRLVLIGDPMQLPATVISSKAASLGYDCSLFERLSRCGAWVWKLSEGWAPWERGRVQDPTSRAHRGLWFASRICRSHHGLWDGSGVMVKRKLSVVSKRVRVHVLSRGHLFLLVCPPCRSPRAYAAGAVSHGPHH